MRKGSMRVCNKRKVKQSAARARGKASKPGRQVKEMGNQSFYYCSLFGPASGRIGCVYKSLSYRRGIGYDNK